MRITSKINTLFIGALAFKKLCKNDSSQYNDIAPYAENQVMPEMYAMVPAIVFDEKSQCILRRLLPI